MVGHALWESGCGRPGLCFLHLDKTAAKRQEEPREAGALFHLSLWLHLPKSWLLRMLERVGKRTKDFP
jgi:hypothetical protein